MKTLSFEQMECIEAGFKFHMPCSVALALYGFAFVGLCAATGGAAICAVISFGAATFDTIAACADELQ
jgi:hypothetical protein